MIEIKQLSKNYGSKVVLQSLNIRLEKGMAYGVVGENGAGKTTLFKSIVGLESFTGSILSPYPVLKNHLGFLPTNPYFLPKITGKEYLQLICNARNIPLPPLSEINIFDLPLDQYAETYSTGMKKKLALLGILLQKNDFLLLDEPFNGVDIQSNMLIITIIQRLKRAGKTLLISSHIFSTLSDTCDQIFVLKGGKIDQVVDHADFSKLDAAMRQVVLKDQLNVFDF